MREVSDNGLLEARLRHLWSNTYIPKKRIAYGVLIQLLGHHRLLSTCLASLNAEKREKGGNRASISKAAEKGGL